MTKLELQLRGTRTAEDVYKDTAITNGYEPEITRTESVVEENLTKTQKDEYVYPETTIESSKKVDQFTREDDSVDYTIKYDYTITEPNPETAEEFGAKLVQKKFATRDAQLAGDAEKKRAELEYEL